MCTITYTGTHTLIYIEGANEFETWKDTITKKTDDKQKRKFQYWKIKFLKQSYWRTILEKENNKIEVVYLKANQKDNLILLSL